MTPLSRSAQAMALATVVCLLAAVLTVAGRWSWENVVGLGVMLAGIGAWLEEGER